MKFLDKLFKKDVGKVKIPINSLNVYHEYRDNISAINTFLDDADVPLNSICYVNGNTISQKLGICGRIAKLAMMVRNGEINDFLAAEIREIAHGKSVDTSENQKLEINRIEMIGKKFKHYKTGNVYMLINFTKDSETLEDMVSYQRVSGDDVTIWSRPLQMFFGKVIVNGQPVDRFEIIKEHN